MLGEASDENALRGSPTIIGICGFVRAGCSKFLLTMKGHVACAPEILGLGLEAFLSNHSIFPQPEKGLFPISERHTQDCVSESPPIVRKHAL
jgi:hypothetical protein